MNLSCTGISSSVLKACSLTVAAGEIAIVRGPSGSGKSLLLRALADLDPHAGEVRLDGIEQAAMPGPAWRRRVRYVAAEPAWWSDRVGDHFRSPGAAGRAAAELGLVEDCMNWSVARLSTGEKQRLGFLRAIEDAPAVLLLDEPTAALDAAAARAMEAVIERLRRGGAAIIVVTHSDAQAATFGGRRYLMEAGRLHPAP